MVSIEIFKKLALSYDEAQELPHFEKTSFRVHKKIFATLDIEKKRACLKFTEIEQSVFGAFDKSIIYPVPGAWGKKGFTYVELKTVRKDMLKDALNVSYCNVAPKKLSEKYKQH
ncbi:MAG: MmcQ/YjbR family DNA-binding protein [Bacteroidetes bacterium]|nr:MmcQ/YjbR family DNA-binding protein [Bacteroidota bacterium]